MIYHTGCGALMATAVLLASAPTYAQTPREQLNPVDVYLQQKSQEFQASQRAADARNAGTTVTALYNLLRDKGPFASAPVVGRTSDEQAKVKDALVRTTAFYLAAIGITPADVTAAQRAGLDPLQAGANIVGPGGTIFDALTVAPIAVVARVAEVSEPSGNPQERSVSFATTRLLKGSAPASFSLQVGSPDPLFASAPGVERLLFLSTEYGAFRRAAGRRGNTGPLAQVFTAYEVQNGAFVPSTPDLESSPIPAPAVDSFISQHSSVFNAR